MGLALATIGDRFDGADATLAALLLVGAIAMRGAGCTWNDILDRKVDAQVDRTRARPLPAGTVSVRNAAIWMAAQCAIGLAVLLVLPRLAQYVALGSIPLVAAYPLMKRITWWPQAWLGLCFSWGGLVAVAAVEGAVPAEALILFAGCVAWVIAYDTIYALQDVEDDALVGVRSTARLFGARWRAPTAGFYALAFLLWTIAAVLADAPFASIAALVFVGATIVAPTVATINGAHGAALTAFKRNALIGLAVAATFAIDPLWRALAPFAS
jgi:4-hydroxybenzoate polyprenyltransferase